MAPSILYAALIPRINTWVVWKQLKAVPCTLGYECSPNIACYVMLAPKWSGHNAHCASAVKIEAVIAQFEAIIVQFLSDHNVSTDSSPPGCFEPLTAAISHAVLNTRHLVPSTNRQRTPRKECDPVTAVRMKTTFRKRNEMTQFELSGTSCSLRSTVDVMTIITYQLE